MGKKLEKRQIELDLLRILAMFAVVMVHTCGMNPENMSYDKVTRLSSTLISALTTWEIPAFVMISGRFFLDPERDVSPDRVKKAVLRLLIAFLVWNVVYQIYYIFTGTYSGLNWKGIVMQVIQGPYHFWFLYMMVGVYLLIPFLRKITENKALMEYFLVLFIVFGFLTNYGPALPAVGSTISTIMDHTSFHFALGFTGYFVAGYYFYKYPLSKRLEAIIYAAGFVLWLGAGSLTAINSVYYGIHDEFFVKFLMPNVGIVTFAIYTLFVKRISRVRFKPSQVFLIKKMSEYSAGIYYIHALTLDLLAMAGFSPLVAFPMITVPLFALVAIFLSGIIIYTIRKIPCVGWRIT